MAKEKKQGLPEINVTEGDIVEKTKQAIDCNIQIAVLESQLKALKEELSTLASDKRIDEVGRGNFIGLIRVTCPDMPTARVEFRMENGSLDVEEEKALDHVYGPSRSLLFGREKIVTAIIKPMELINELIEAGKNPFDYLELTVKKGMDNVLAESANVVCNEAFLPKEGFLNTVQDIKHTMSETAIGYTSEYLNIALKPRIVLGSKGKA